MQMTQGIRHKGENFDRQGVVKSSMSISFRSFWSKLDHAENAFTKVSLGVYTGNQRKGGVLRFSVL